MKLIAYMNQHRVSSFVMGTIGFQCLVVIIGLYLNSTTPSRDVAVPEQEAVVEDPQPMTDAMTSATLLGAGLYDNSGEESEPTEEKDTSTLKNIAPGTETETGTVVKEKAAIEKTAEQKTQKAGLPEVITHTIASGDTLTTIWSKYGSTYSGGVKAAQAFKNVGVSVNSLRIGEKIELQIAPEGDITGLKKKLSKGRALLLDGNATDGYKATIIEPETEEVELKISGVIHNSFFAAARHESLPVGVIDDLADIFSDRLEFRRQIQPGDTFTVVYSEQRLTDGTVVAAGPVRAASIMNKGKLLAAVRYADKNGKVRYYDENGEPAGNFFLRYPLRFTRISSTFSHSRLHPILKIRRPHHGIDFAAPVGTAVRSVADGTVIYKGYSKGAGRMVKIRHASKYVTTYMHLHNYGKGIYKGARIERGQVIASVGSSGLSTGPHLDFRMAINGRYVNPLTVKLPRSPQNYEVIPASLLTENLNVLKASHDALLIALLREEKKEA